ITQILYKLLINDTLYNNITDIDSLPKLLFKIFALCNMLSRDHQIICIIRLIFIKINEHNKYIFFIPSNKKFDRIEASLYYNSFSSIGGWTNITMFPIRNQFKKLLEYYDLIIDKSSIMVSGENGNMIKEINIDVYKSYLSDSLKGTDQPANYLARQYIEQKNIFYVLYL